MIGCIVTGHGDFGPGLSRAVEMIAGDQEHFNVVPFHEEDPLDSLEKNMQEAVEALLKETKGVLIFSDLLGGTPFRTAMVVAAQYDNVEVLTGTNLPMLIECGFLRTYEEDVKALAKKAIETGKEGIQNPQLEASTDEPNEDDEAEGI